jgi:stage II sporulation protein GA (sporulation sigma-E factor processing peptidase)
MLALWMLLRPKSMLYYNGIVYFDISAVTLLAPQRRPTCCKPLLALRQGRTRRRLRPRRDPALSGRETRLSAMVDSGNRLTEPFSGSPAAVCRLEALRPLLSPQAFDSLEREDYEKAGEFGMKLRFIPYNVINGSGILPAFRPDALLLETPAGSRHGGDAWIAVFRGQMSCDALLNPDIAATRRMLPAGCC